ncbi:MAG: efflux RND transporter periplasmic adaptor subunit [Marinilabiliales bacterium]|nr:MAG: efflux RND transporter periplasmic adaptor subunit [Marinilabiliales bacterium]
MAKLSKKNRRYIIWGLVGLVILLIVLRRTGVIGGSDTIKVAVEDVTRHEVVETVSASGKIYPVREVKLSPDVSGEIVELLVKEGDRVKKGDVLARITTDIYQANYDQVAASVNSQRANLANSEARLSQTEAQYINAEATYNRNKQLYERGAISEAEYESAEAQYQVAKADVEAAKQTVNASKYNVYSALASMTEANKNLTRTIIIAPVDGTISQLNVEVGERVAGASQFSAGTEILRIADLQEMEVVVSVNENEVVKLELGDTANVEVDAYPDQEFKGIVTEIANSATVSGTSVDQVSNFDVTIRILASSYANMIPEDDKEFSPFRPGMSATVDIITEKARDVIAVPVQSVTTREAKKDTAKDEDEKEDELLEYVFVIDNGTAVLREVKTGIQDNEYIQIIEGLEEQEKVIVAPYSAIAKKLQGGESVKIVPRKELFELN